MPPRRRKRPPTVQKRPTFQTMWKTHQSGLNMTQEYGRRRLDPPSEENEAEFGAFLLLEKAYKHKYKVSVRKPLRKKPKKRN